MLKSMYLTFNLAVRWRRRRRERFLLLLLLLRRLLPFPRPPHRGLPRPLPHRQLPSRVSPRLRAACPRGLTRLLQVQVGQGHGRQDQRQGVRSPVPGEQDVSRLGIRAGVPGAESPTNMFFLLRFENLNLVGETLRRTSPPEEGPHCRGPPGSPQEGPQGELPSQGCLRSGGGRRRRDPGDLRELLR